VVGEGFRLADDALYVCVDCWRVLETIIKDALPEAVRRILERAEEPVDSALQPYYLDDANAPGDIRDDHA
jgi:hypothetical protein